MITDVHNFAPDSDLIVIHTSDGEKIIVERDGYGKVHVTLDNLIGKGTPYMRAFVLGEEGEK